MQFRRRVWLTLGLVAPTLALFVGMRAAASWRPVAVERIIPRGEVVERLNVGAGQVSFSQRTDAKGRRLYGWLDIASGKIHKSLVFVPRRTGVSGDYQWTLQIGDAAQTLEVTNGRGFKRTFTGHNIFPPQRGELPVRVLPAQNRVVLMGNDRIIEWDFATGRLRRTALIEESVTETLTRDGLNFVSDGYANFVFGDARSGKVFKKVRWRVAGPTEYSYVSPYGRYFLFDSMSGKMRVVDALTGKSAWGFTVASMWNSEWMFADDERTIFVTSGKKWEVRDLRTGAVLRRLPCVPNVDDAALSPDGATLYSVADGVLYRQRAR